MHKKGFTLIELLVVISIIGVLSSVVLATLNTVRGNARDARRISDMDQIQLALELFYNDYERYPITPGGPTWDDHWEYLQECLSAGTNCGFSTGSFTSVLPNVPNDPLDDPNTSSDADPTYFAGWEGRTPQNYILRVRLENTNNPILDQDADGGWRTAVDNLCNDPWYCIKKNYPW